MRAATFRNSRIHDRVDHWIAHTIFAMDFLDQAMDPMISGLPMDGVPVFDSKILFDLELMKVGETFNATDLPSPAQTVPAGQDQSPIFEELNNVAPYEDHSYNNGQGQPGTETFFVPNQYDQQWQCCGNPYQTLPFEQEQYPSEEFDVLTCLRSAAARVDVTKYENSAHQMHYAVDQQYAVNQPTQEPLNLNALAASLAPLEPPSRYSKSARKPYEKKTARQTRAQSKAQNKVYYEEEEEEGERAVPVAPVVSATRRVRGKPAGVGEMTSVQKHRKKEKDFIESAPKAIAELTQYNEMIEGFNRELLATVSRLHTLIPQSWIPNSY